MGAPAPDDITEPRLRGLWWQLSKQYEIHCGVDKALWPERTREFQEVIHRISRMLDEGRGE